MNKKESIIAAAIGVGMTVMLFVGVVLFVLFLPKIYNNSVDLDDYATRYEWIEMLGKFTGITQNQTTETYFNDVASDDPYFNLIQAAVEWGVLDTAKESEFHGEIPASGEFVALTCMKSISKYKTQIYLESMDELTDEQYIQLAINNKLIDSKDLKRNLSKKNCEKVLEHFSNLYFGEFWRDNFSSIMYKDEVVELKDDALLKHDSEYLNVTIKKDALERLKNNTIVVYKKEYGLKAAGKITDLNYYTGECVLSYVDTDEVIEAMYVSGISTLTLDDIINYYGSDKVTKKTNTSGFRNTGLRIFNDMKQNGFSIGVSTESQGDISELSIELEDMSTHLKYTLPIHEKLPSGCFYQGDISIENITVGVCAAGQYLSPDYAELSVDAKTSVNQQVIMGSGFEKKITIYKTPIPIGNGAVGVDLEFDVILSANGEISFEAKCPTQLSTIYEEGKTRIIKHAFPADKPKAKVKIEGQVFFRTEPTLVILEKGRIIDSQYDIGLTASVKTIPRNENMICTNVRAMFPIIELGICEDKDNKTIIGETGISAHYNILNKANSAIINIMDYHVESFKKENLTQFVEKCTYIRKIGVIMFLTVSQSIVYPELFIC